MRYVPINCLRDGMVVGKNLIGNNNQILLKTGTQVTDKYIAKLEELGFNGIYVIDNLSKDIYIQSIIDDNLRQKTTNDLKKLFIIEDTKKNREFKFNQIQLQVENIVDEIINNKNLMINMIDLKTFDEYTFAHSVNVAVLSIVIGLGLNMKRESLYRLGLGALLHDMGKVFVGTDIVNKPSKLTEEEFEKMKEHSKLGYDYLKKEFDLFPSSYRGVIDHHEKFDGTGYPSNLKGDKISLNGRIIAIADVYDALTSNRPYRKGMLPSEAIEYIMSTTGQHFDPEITKVFLKKIAPYPLGTCVKLSSGLEGIVIKNYNDTSLRPKLRIYKKNGVEIEPFEICLKTDKSYLSSIISEIVV